MKPGARTPIVAANWKMHKTAADVGPYFEALWSAAPAKADGTEVVFFPPATILEAVVRALGGRALAGAQNCHWEPQGAYTGEISAPMVAAAGAAFVLVGHSERRGGFGETDEDCARKLRAALSAGLRPLLCVGETLEERDRGRQRTVVLRQLARALEGLSAPEYARVAIAYEPVWAIGTGRTAAPEDAAEMHAAIREALAGIASPAAAAGASILYGGSVTADNVAALAAGEDVDGALVGGASLDPRTFAAIIRGAREAAFP